MTAALNFNLLERPCREFEADLDPQFIFAYGVLQRSAIAYRDALGQRYCQKIEVVDEIFRFEAGETQHTENSYKYTIEGFQVLVGRAGFSSES